MRKVAVRQLIPVRILLNTSNRSSHQWAKIVDARTGKILHTGQLAYIKRLAKLRYLVAADL
jgi:DUF917 family protein